MPPPAKGALFIAAAVACAANAQAQPRAFDGSLTGIVQQLRKELPAGWKLNQTDNHWVLRREKPVAFYNAINLPALENKEELREYTYQTEFLIVVRFGPKVTPMQYEALQADNRRADQQHKELTRGMRGISHKFGDYAPANADEQARVDAFEKAVAELFRHQLPDGTIGRHSVYIETTRPWSDSFFDESESKECQRVRESLAAKFQAYAE